MTSTTMTEDTVTEQQRSDAVISAKELTRRYG